MYPRAARWVNTCLICHAQGYKPEMPETLNQDQTILKNNLMRYFKPLAVNDLGICAQCAAVQKKSTDF